MNIYERDEMWGLIERQAAELVVLARGARTDATEPEKVRFKSPRTAAAHALGIASYVEEIANKIIEGVDGAKL